MAEIENVSAAYLLVTAFDYEIRNYVDIRIAELTSTDSLEDLSEHTSDELGKLKVVKEFLLQRIGKLKP